MDSPTLSPETLRKPPEELAPLPLDMGFLRRTAVATLATEALVALFATGYGHPLWAWVYLASGLWALTFFALTPLIIQALIIQRRRLRALGFMALKIVGLAFIFMLCRHWAETLSMSPAALGSALIAGVTTPLAVVVLRALGARTGEGAAPTSPPTNTKDSQP